MATEVRDLKNVEIDDSWKEVLQDEFAKDYFKELKKFLGEEKKKGVTIYPPGRLIFNAFNQTPFDEVKVVILGQDPYHGAKQANGMCFSVSEEVTPPPSLRNIFKEIETDVNSEMSGKGDLTRWAQQGVFLLNAILTVQAKNAGSHRKKGWEEFTDAVIKAISDRKEGVVFLLWGKFAQEKEELIDTSKHHVLKAAHPSPYSADRGFFGCKHFSKTNTLLEKAGKEPIDWGV